MAKRCIEKIVYKRHLSHFLFLLLIMFYIFLFIIALEYIFDISSSRLDEQIVYVRMSHGQPVNVSVPIGGLLIFEIIINDHKMIFHNYTVDDGAPIKTLSRFRCSQVVYDYFIHKQSSTLNPNNLIKVSDYLYNMLICPSPDRYGTYKFYFKYFDSYHIVQATVLADKSKLYDNPYLNFPTITYEPLALDKNTANEISMATIFFFITEYSIKLIIALCSGSFIIIFGLVQGFLLKTMSLRINVVPPEKDWKEILCFIALIIFYLVLYTCGYDFSKLFYIAFLYMYILFFKTVEVNIIRMIYIDDDLYLCDIKPSTQLKVLYDIFLSYSDTDLDIINCQILPELENRNLQVFFREKDILGGRNELSSICQAICQSRAFLILITENYLNEKLRHPFEINTITQFVSDSGISGKNVHLLFAYKEFEHNSQMLRNYLKTFVHFPTLTNDEKTIINTWVQDRKLIPVSECGALHMFWKVFVNSIKKIITAFQM